MKYFIVYISQGSEYITVSRYAKVVDILGFCLCRGSFKKTLHHICLTGFRMFHRFWIWHGSKYARLHRVLKKCLYYRHLIGQFSCKITHYGKDLMSVLQHLFASINKIFILAGRLGARLSFYKVLRLFWYILIS